MNHSNHLLFEMLYFCIANIMFSVMYNVIDNEIDHFQFIKIPFGFNKYTDETINNK